MGERGVIARVRVAGEGGRRATMMEVERSGRGGEQSRQYARPEGSATLRHYNIAGLGKEGWEETSPPSSDRIIEAGKCWLTSVGNSSITSLSISQPNQLRTSPSRFSVSATPSSSTGSLGAIPSNKDLKVDLALSDKVADHETREGM